ncbi:putative disease resistance RPP13-like protein 1 [Durio zibethinus]|uniref:Disease resistance RPP13-like protein 1 n=1 Tax=Durio zibethinus TaxID=66656 RepID=A0A6P5Z6D4_DURZI|nr:putative disease resistance RPP13-like protein 1 [Durio zibethinus]
MSLLGALSTIREVVVSKFFDYLLDKLGSSEFLQFVSEKQIQLELQKLKKELLEIRALLDDAGERQIKDQSVKIWLSDLQNLAYDVDDIVDELETEIARRNLMLERHGSSTEKPRLISETFNVVLFNRGMMSKIKDITAKLKDLEPRRNQLQLRMIDCSKSNIIKERQQPTSLEIETLVCGRDKDKEIILELVFNSDDEGNFVIPIVGMGGIGKTTLAQLIYNDATVRNHFDLKAWVCVSEDFDVTRITKTIFQAVTSEPCNDNDLNSLQEKLKNKLSGKNFLIVLDDVWNENYHDWTILQSPFLTRTPGSKIIMTTRSFAVSSTMGASHSHSLQVLSEDDCLSVFAQHALGARDFGRHPNLKEVAEKIVRKCNGLPLAAKILGGLLRTNVDHDAWKEILESEIWKLSDLRCGIIPALQLSYHRLPPHLKRCFAYCSILPKDYEFQEREIILLWRAEGFLQEARDKHSIEDLGHKYFRDLVSRSLLQISNKDRSRFIMHDLINDLAQSVAGEICFRIDGDQKISKYARHLSYIGGEFDGIKKFKSLVKHNIYVLFCHLGCQIIRLPDFIGDLKHLRYLDFSHTPIKCLPESVSTLYNLETLLLRECLNLEKLPSEMENLVNLCYLDITGAYSLEGMPSNFCTLSDLQTLSHFVLQKGKGCQIRELEGLPNLKGQLCVSGLENVVETQDAWEAKLHEKSGLDKLELKWSGCFENRRGDIEKNVLHFLQPSKKLKELALEFYCGVRLMEWIGDSSFNKLLSLCLDDCPNCTSLPSIGQLPLLKKLRIKGLDNVTSVGVEFFGKNAPNAFPSLETLEFENMLKWENWNFFEVNEEARKYPKLRELSIVNCPELLGSIPENLPSLEKLVISYCKKLVISIQSFPMLSELDVRGCHEVLYKGFRDNSSLKRVCFSRIPKFTCVAEWLTLGSIKVDSLVIDDCEELCSLQENNWGLLTQSMSLNELSIGKWSQLVSIGAEEEREELMQLKIPCTIQKLTIRDCERLEKLSTTLHFVTSLRMLVLWYCPNLISLSNNNLPSNLKCLKIEGCVNLRCLLEEGEHVNLSSACPLEQMNISYCPSLISLSKNNLPSNLRSLKIECCVNLRCLLEEGENVDISNAGLLEQLDIKACPSLVSLSSKGELPTRLKQLAIYSCEKLESIAQEIQDNSSLESIIIKWCSNIKYLPQGLNKLSHLRCIHLGNCSNLVSFPESGLPTSNLKVLCLYSCEKLQALPDCIHNLSYLEELEIKNCSSLTSFPEEGIPTNLRQLTIEGPNICKPLIKWGLHRLTSLKSLNISNVLFPQEEIQMTLPCSLTHLTIINFPKLETLSFKGFHDLTSLEYLSIDSCPNLMSLPEKKMLSSLLQLYIWICPVLKERCEKDKGSEWSKIAHIPCVEIDNRHIHDSC